ncbi:hypothetical protein Q9S36_09030 [Microbacterium sp. ARD31]|uniref:hypothetical protein n=1 Tax=Microbacterium sp. ARD31 TaxID=2962576 RepID=UPI0028825088|nr:hypothetical protein [Microbacterium sp. ARD31]MDT0180348.1 hypothetical protein [Microbacterium sp. ARD31]
MTRTADSQDLAPNRTRRLLSFARRALVVELRIYSSIGRAIARRPAIAPGARGYSYHRPVQTILLIFIVLSAVEIPIIDLIVHRWPTVRIAFLILGIWGLTWMVGLLCGQIVRPHTVGPAGISVREGLELDIPLTWDQIASVSRSPRVDEPKSPRVTQTASGRELAVRMQDETNIEIELERPTLVRLPGLHPKGGTHEVDRVRIWADDPDAFLDGVRAHIP